MVVVAETATKTLTLGSLLMTSERPIAARTCVALYILTWKCASRHNSVHFFASQLLKVLKLQCFVHFDLEMCFAPQRRAIFHLSSGYMAPHPFDPPEPQIIGKTQCFATRDFSTFSRTCIFFLLTLSLL